MYMYVLEAILFAAALSADLFVITAGYGLQGREVGLISKIMMSAVCTATLFASLILRGIIANAELPPNLLAWLSFLLLAGLGFWKLLSPCGNDGNAVCESRGGEAQETVPPEFVKMSECIAVGFMSSADGFAAGLATPYCETRMWFTAAIFMTMSLLSSLAGHRIGLTASSLLGDRTKNLGRFAGLILLILATVRLLGDL